MQRFINEHAWFAFNAVLVSGLIALASALSARSEPQASQPSPSQASSSASVQGLILSPQDAHEVVPEIQSGSVRSAPQPGVRPSVQGGEREQEYDDD